MIRCDRCGEGESEILRSVRVIAEDRERIEEILEEVACGCVVCWLEDLRSRSSSEGSGHDWRHRRVDCANAEIQEEGLAEARGRIRFERGTHSCLKCSFSQKMCVTGRDSEQRCQWPNVMTAVMMAARQDPIGRGIIRRAGFRGGLDVDREGEGEGDRAGEGGGRGGLGGLGEYFQWLGWRHRGRIWEEVMSNGMAVVLEFILWSETV